ncbi:sigma-70 family RNA polymerase sigma factor [Pedobacter cryotolerans]|uniref:Sigma-70 family RNA polymerase sigma factor n=1 Tax=Pedobacter cryotolerans TaxID=2571270 RepID=A0A4U1CDD3_9SPHI|nr:sigma-70 family RNA polymerase sigma factor [Pedobacter cryotolerans]TKC01994.1 sigma-70 family RNA polymerase sigma factor [Pedobacter cryotolerans]
MSVNQNQVVKETENIILAPAEWVNNYADFLYKYAVVRVNDDEIAKDLLQETFFSALKGISNFKGESSERTWLVAILKHKIIDHYRNASRMRSKSITNESTEDEFFEKGNGHWNRENRPTEFSSVSNELQEKEFALILKKCIKKMPALWSAVFTLKHIDEEETDYILQEMKISSANFWVIIHRSKLNLRACLQKNWL